MYLRVSTTGADVQLADLGIKITDPTSNFVISNQFDVEDLETSRDLAAAIQGGSLSAQVLLDGVWTTVSSADFDRKDPMGAFANIFELINTENNEALVNNSDVESSGPSGNPLHVHDTRYYQKTQIQNTGTTTPGASLVGVDNSNFNVISGTNVQDALDSIDDQFTNFITLDQAYKNDPDGRLDVNDSSKPLNFRSDNNNDVLISRTNGSDIQNALQLDVGSDELALGDVLSGSLARLLVRIKTDLIVDGDITFNGDITDQTVNELNVTNANIIMRDGASSGADATLQVERGSTGPDAALKWDETADRWKAGLEGDNDTIALLELNEVVSGVWEFQGGSDDPNMYLTQKSSAPTTNLGTSTQIPMAMINGRLATYDKTNSRNKWLSVQREYMVFTGRNNQNNTNEYARIANNIPSNLVGNRLTKNATLIGMSIQTPGTEDWTAEVRKNDGTTVLASISASSAEGNEDDTFNVDFSQGDEIQVFINGSQIDRPVIKLEFAYRF